MNIKMQVSCEYYLTGWYSLMNKEQNVQVSDTTKYHGNTAAG